MTAGVDGTTMDDMSDSRIEKIISSLKDCSYKPNPARREYIAKKNNSRKKRSLGILSGNDKLVQEVVRMILESIFEPNFSQSSHGFRPKRSCHSALKQIHDTFTGAHWFVEGDIEACFDSFDHHVLIDLLRRRIDDEAFIALMWKFLKAGYMEQWQYHNTYDGVPQGSGMSPILANIYLDELDKEKTKITHTGDHARFLGYDITVSRDQKAVKIKDGRTQRCHSYVVRLLAPREKWVGKLLEYKAMRVVLNDNGKERYKALHRGKLINKPDIEILSAYNAEIRGLYNFYSLANNAYKTGKFANVMKYSNCCNNNLRQSLRTLLWYIFKGFRCLKLRKPFPLPISMGCPSYPVCAPQDTVVQYLTVMFIAVRAVVMTGGITKYSAFFIHAGPCYVGNTVGVICLD